jgi:hypothetical protein
MKQASAKDYANFQKAIFNGAQETSDTEERFIPYGRCPRHPEQATSNGMFDTPCPICEMNNDQ